MITIKLSKTWYLDDASPLGSPGGFGSVFKGTGEDGREVAIKLFHVARKQNAVREVDLARFISTGEHPHVIPVLDVGTDEYTGDLAIVMARAARNLQQYILDAAPLPEPETLDLLDAIAAGLQEMGGVVHRDLKPANVLEHDGVWKIADWGLARFVNATTSEHTMQDFLSAPYAAPELWRGERATRVADVYSLGCITYSLITGHPPFNGPDKEDYKQQHESSAPSALPASHRLQQLTARCLAKAPALRPPIDSYRVQLSHIRSPKPALQKSRLAVAASALAAERARAEAARIQELQKEKERKAIAAEAVIHVVEILHGLVDLIRTEVPEIESNSDRKHDYLGSENLGIVLELGEGVLACDLVKPYVAEDTFGKTWDIYCLAKVEVVRRNKGFSGPPPSRSANLAFGRVGTDTDLAWWELGFMLGKTSLGSNHDHARAPFSLGDGNSWSGYRWSIGLGWDTYDLAYNPRRIDGEHLESFYQRWIDLFSRMATGDWTEPESLPEETIEPRFKFVLDMD